VWAEDECGGLPPGQAKELPQGNSLEQRELRVRNLPGHGGAFTADLPRRGGPSA
jgi:hypothetical protein